MFALCYSTLPLLDQGCNYNNFANCQGCILGSSCIKSGTRSNFVENIPVNYRPNDPNRYCSLSGHWIAQKPDNAACQNDYECQGNVCINNKCTNLQQELAQNTGLLNQILSKITTILARLGLS